MTRSCFSATALALVTGFVVSFPALAADPHGKDHGSGGLPQFDPSSYSSQVFWLVLVFAFLYVFFSRKTLPTISSVIENRREQVEGDRATAERLRNEAETVLDTYEKGLNNARAEAMRLNADAVAETKSQLEQAVKAMQKKAETQIAELESNLEAAKSKTMDDMNTIAAEVASAAAEKIVGITADLNQAKSVVQSLNKMSKAA